MTLPGSGPLSGIRVVEIATFIAAPGGTQLLASQGADVIKVEDTVVGDPLRLFGSSRNGMSGWFANLNAGKRSLCMNIASEQGRAAMADLLETADVFVQAYRPGVAERLGIGEQDIRRRNRNVIYVSISGYGRDGPYSDRPAYDAVIQAWSGIASVQGADDEPQFVRSFIPDKVTSLMWTQAVCAALYQRERSGFGERVELSLLDAAVSFMWPDSMMDHVVMADDADHRPNLLNDYRLLRCRDGYVAVMPLTDGHWQGVADAFARPDLLTDPRFAQAGPRAAHFGEMLDTLGELVADVARDDVVDRLIAADVPVAPALRPAEVAHNVQIRHSGVIREVEHPVVGPIRQQQPAARFGNGVPELRHAVNRGADTDAILAELGRTPGDVAALRAEGVVL